jgi:alkanesulfonate monooxygenase SsuD/methylene tetrahydromethanopterin reductase-like flavin-dependent oxidoreductase (luciferase family)
MKWGNAMADDAQSSWRPHPWAAEGRRRPRFGIFGGPLDDWPALVDWVQTIEALGFDSFWLPDHPAFAPDCWTTLAALAGVTTRLRLGPLVACAGYRHPLLLARQAADVDRLSGGRLVLGLGIGDYEVEMEQLGVPLDLPARQRMLEETVRAVYGRWGDAPFPPPEHDGAEAPARLPHGPVQQPHVPLLIAGGGERVTLRQVARYADAANFGPSNVTGAAWDADDIRRKLDALRRHCEALGRPYESVLRTHVHPGGGVQIRADGPLIHDRVRRENVDFEHARFVGTPGDAVAHFRALADAGLQYFIVGIGRDAESLRLLGEEVIPAVTAG